MTLQLALFAAAVTLTAAGFRFANEALFLLAGLLAPFALACDLITKWKYMTPVLYKLARREVDDRHEESLALLFIAYSPRKADRVRAILAGPDDKIKFRRYFFFRHLEFKFVFYGAILVVEVWLALSFQQLEALLIRARLCLASFL
jgi:hypothetical protein